MTEFQSVGGILIKECTSEQPDQRAGMFNLDISCIDESPALFNKMNKAIKELISSDATIKTITKTYDLLHHKTSELLTMRREEAFYDIRSALSEYTSYVLAMKDYVHLALDLKDGDVDLQCVRNKFMTVKSNDTAYTTGIFTHTNMTVDQGIKQIECLVDLSDFVNARRKDVAELSANVAGINNGEITKLDKIKIAALWMLINSIKSFCARAQEASKFNMESIRMIVNGEQLKNRNLCINDSSDAVQVKQPVVYKML